MTYRVLVSDPLSDEGIKPLREIENIEIVKNQAGMKQRS